jgi:hypothetical protein
MLELPEVRALLADRLRGRPTRANFRTGHLTMCTLVPMRSVPHLHRRHLHRPRLTLTGSKFGAPLRRTEPRPYANPRSTPTPSPSICIIWARTVSLTLLGAHGLESCDSPRPDRPMRLSAPR